MEHTEEYFLDEYPPALVQTEKEKIVALYSNNKAPCGRFTADEINYIRTLWLKRKDEVTYCELMKQIFECSKYPFSRRFDCSLREFKASYIDAKAILDEHVEEELIKRFLYREVPNAEAQKALYQLQKQQRRAA